MVGEAGNSGRRRAWRRVAENLFAPRALLGRHPPRRSPLAPLLPIRRQASALETCVFAPCPGRSVQERRSAVRRGGSACVRAAAGNRAPLLPTLLRDAPPTMRWRWHSPLRRATRCMGGRAQAQRSGRGERGSGPRRASGRLRQRYQESRRAPTCAPFRSPHHATPVTPHRAATHGKCLRRSPAKMMPSCPEKSATDAAREARPPAANASTSDSVSSTLPLLHAGTLMVARMPSAAGGAEEEGRNTESNGVQQPTRPHTVTDSQWHTRRSVSSDSLGVLPVACVTPVSALYRFIGRNGRRHSFLSSVPEGFPRPVSCLCCCQRFPCNCAHA